MFRQVESDAMPHAKGRVLIYAALSLSGVISENDLEQRIAALETAQEQRGTNDPK